MSWVVLAFGIGCLGLSLLMTWYERKQQRAEVERIRQLYRDAWDQ